MDVMHRQTALVSAAILLGCAGSASALEGAWPQPAMVEAQGALQSIPVERVRPERPVQMMEPVAVERQRPMRAADILASMALATLPDEASADVGSTSTPDEPSRRRPNPIPFDRSALVPTGSRNFEERSATTSTRQPGLWEREWTPSARFAGLVPTPLPSGASTTTTAQVVSQPQTQTQPETQAQPVTQAWTAPAATAADAVSAIEEARRAIETELAPVAQTTTAVDQEAQPVVQSEPIGEPVAAVDPVAEPAVEPVVTAQAAAAVETETVQAAGAFEQVQTSEVTTTTQRSSSTNVSTLASMFPAPEGWNDRPRSAPTRAGWDLVPTPMPTVASSPAREPEPETTAAAVPMTMHTDDAAELLPVIEPAGWDVPHAPSLMPAAEPTHTASAEPVASMSRADDGFEGSMTVRSAADAETIESERAQLLRRELERKQISPERYEAALKRLSERRERQAWDGSSAQAEPLIAGDALGKQMARSAGYID